MILKNNKFSSEIELHHFSMVDQKDVSLNYLKWLNDEEIAKMLALPNRSLKDQSFINESFKRFTQESCMGFFIKKIDDNLFIGTCKIDKIDLVNKSCEIGIMIGEKKFYGKGISKIVFQILLDYAFNNLQLNRVWGGCLSNNTAMNKTFQRLNFRNEGLLKEAILFNNKFIDTKLYAITKKEYNLLNHKI